MEKVTEERLVKAGWDEKRTIDISNIKDVYQKLGLVMPMNVEKFLTVYGMLVFEDDERKENLEFIPEKALGCNLDKVGQSHQRGDFACQKEADSYSLP